MTKAPSKVQVRYFRPPPFKEGLRRFASLAILAYFIGFVVMGVVASFGAIQKSAARQIPISPAPTALEGSTLQLAQRTHVLVWHYLTHVPDPCLSDARAKNDFQRDQCKSFWDRLQDLGWVAAIPFLFAGGFIFFAWDGVRQRFQSARKKISKGKATGLAIVADPPEAAPDRVGWWYGVQPITVQVADGKQVIAYLAPEAPIPPPGEKVALYDWGKIGGQQRFFAVLYAPHVAVLQGG
ncbi:MAG: hypothetical protein KGQ59_05510 [Bdellovibrionales bacterium]|nr:hypothetical protein [Bdellovibrionales bacterium]